MQVPNEVPPASPARPTPFAIRDEPLGEVPADAVAALHRPHPILVPPADLEHRGVTIAVSTEPALAEDPSPAR
jgi:hypothetical protein